MAKKVVRYRSSESGQYVKESFAKSNPKTTVKETDKSKNPNNKDKN